MKEPALFGVSVVMSFLAFGIVASLYIVPRLRLMGRREALLAMVVPNAFRFEGLGFLVPGVVSPALPHDFAAPAAYGDLIAAVLAMLAILALSARSSVAVPLVWIFNVWGIGDLLHAMYDGQIGIGISPGNLGAMYFIPTIVVPALLILHGLIFWLLLQPERLQLAAGR